MTLTQPDARPIKLTKKERKKHGIKWGRTAYVLNNDWCYKWEIEGRIRRINMPKGFIYDLASVPRAGALIGIHPDGLHRAAATIHDWIYEHEGELPKGSYQEFIDGEWVDLDDVWIRENADRIFCRIMKESGVGRKRRWIMFKVVHRLGWIAWRD